MGGYVCRNVHRGLRSGRRIACFNISAIPPFVHAAGMIRFLRRNSLSLAAHSIGQLVPGGFAMFRRAAILTVVCGVAFGTFGARSLHAQSSSAQDPPAAPSPVSKVPKAPVPAYHAGPPKDPLPDTLDPAQFSDAETRNIFTLAAKVKPVLYQQPCYCGCDKEVGHKSLLDCFTDYHGAHCVLCKKEAALTYSETQLGKTAAEIRKEIIDGKWKQVELSDYDTLPPTK